MKRGVEVEYSKKFLKSLSKLPKNLHDKAEEKELIFKLNPYDARLETHKLHGKDREHWAFSIDKKYRIKFAFLSSDSVLYLDIGTHDDVY